MFNISLIITICLTFTSSHPQADHALYLSVVEIEHEKGSHDASIKIKVFIDDMEDAILNEQQQNIVLSDPSAFKSQKEMLERYFSNHFLFSVNKEKQKISLSRTELNGDAIWFYFHVNCIGNWNEVSVKANYLTELFPTQSNVVSIQHEGKKHFIRLTKTNDSETVRF